MEQRTGLPSRQDTSQEFEEAAGNGLLHRRALLGKSIAAAGVLGTALGPNATGAGAEPLTEPPWSLQAGEDTPPEKVFKLQIVVTSEGFNLVADQDQQPIPKRTPELYDLEKLGTELKKIKDTHADKNDIQILSEDAIKFETLVKTMDVALTNRFSDVSLLDAGGAGM